MCIRDSLEAFNQNVGAVITHDVDSQLNNISAPTLVTFGRYDLITSLRFAEPIRSKIPNTEMIVFEDASHTPIYEKVDEFNQRTIAFLESHSGKTATTGTT